jgi:hypothetical protein
VRRIATAALCAALVVTWGLGGASAPAFAGDASPKGDDTATSEDAGPEEALTQKIGVWRLDALGIEAELVARLETLFRSELDRLAKQPLPTRREMEKAVGKDKTLRECTGEEKCLTTIGQKVGVDVMVTGSIAALGDSYILNIKAVDVKTGKELRRIATDPLRGSPDELIESVRVAAYNLLAPEQVYGSIAVLSDLVGATVTLDGKPAGNGGKVALTPLRGPLEKISLGKHRLRVEEKGYQPFDEEVEVRFQKTTRVAVRLAPAEETTTTDGTPKVVQRYGKKPWYTSKWMYVAAGVAAVLVGGAIGWAAGKDTVVDCTMGSTDPRCM